MAGDGEAGAGATGGSAGAAEVDGGDAGHPSTDASIEPPCVKGSVSGSQIIFIGDSFLAAPTSNIAFELEALMQAAGSSAYCEAPRFWLLFGTTMEQIVQQYDTEHALDPDIKVVIANGGGNDVLVTDRSCLLQAPPENAGCAATVDNALMHATRLMEKAEADGVEHVVYFFYPHEPTAGLFQGDAPAINDSLDYAEPMARALCESSPICTFVSLSEAAGDSPGSGYVVRGYHDLDGTHPSPEGSKFFAAAIWDAMVERCIAQ
jgi:lysophospholipase L1-like esterase